MCSFLEELNEEQYAAVTLDSNAAVSAGAGSGKTRVLAARYLWLVTEGICRADEILTITFTNKAANEMHSRIYRLLSENRSNPLAKHAVDNFHTAAISTLDSFCGSVARSASRSYGISPDFSSDINRARELSRLLALRFVLDNRNNPGLRELIAEKKIRGVAGELFAGPVFRYSPVSRPLDFSAFAAIQQEKLLQDWKEKTSGLSLIINELKKETAGVRNIAFEKELRDALGAETPAPRMEFFLSGGQKNSHEAETERRATENYFSFLARICSITMSGHGSKYPRIKECRDMVKSRLFGELEAIANHALQWDIIEAVYPLMEEYQALFNKKKREMGVLSFADIAHLAVDALSDDAELRQMYKNTFKKIMIDEFQDNNMLQRDLVYLLAERYERREKGVPGREDLVPGKLFFVGDEKQSIYRFRGADVSVFRSLTGDFAASSLQLSSNYRSRPMLIKAFNRIFGGLRHENDGVPSRGIFPPGGKESWEASYTWLKSPEKSAAEDAKPLLHFAFLDKNQMDEDDPLSAEDIEAAYIAGKIRELVESGETIYDRTKQTARPVQYEDCAVLQRYYTHQRELEKQFKLFGIPFSAERPAGLFSDAPANDLAALLRLLVYPCDRIAYGALLRSPLVRLSDAAFTVCMLHEGGPFSEELDGQIPEDERELYRNGRKLYQEFLDASGTLPVSQLVTKLWYDEGYSYQTIWPPQAQVYSGLYDLFFELARHIEEQGKGLPEFLDYLEDLAAGEEKPDEAELPGENEGGVRLMSIHKCKGLEFPVVFIFNCGQKERSGIQTGLSDYSRNWGVSLRLPKAAELPGKGGNYFSILEKNENEQKNSAELRRLLYVAMTRAECRLYITASLSGPKDQALYAEKGGYTSEYIRECLVQLYTPELKPNSFLNLLIPVLAETEDNAFTIEPVYALRQANLYELAGQIRSRTGAREREQNAASCESVKKAALSAAPLYLETKTAGRGPLIPSTIPASELHVPYRSQTRTAAETSERNKTELQTEFNFGETPETIPETNAETEQEKDELDALLEKTGLESEDFGAIVHSFIEQRFTNPAGKHVRIPPRFRVKMNERHAETISRRAGEMAGRFFASELGHLSASSSCRETEFPILTSADGSLVSGKIDLLFEAEHSIHVVDFKTDKIEDPRRHIGQLALYRRAVSDIYGKPVQCSLFFTRSGRTLPLHDRDFTAGPEELVQNWKREHP